MFLQRLLLLLPWRRAERGRSLEEELRMHEEMAREDGKPDLSSGLQAREAAREIWTFGTLERLSQDLRYTLRSLGRARTFTAVSILSLALGCASATAIFSLVNGIVLRPLGYREPGQLVFVRQIAQQLEYLYPTLPVNIQHFDYWRKHTQKFESMSAMKSNKATLTGHGDPEQIDIADVSANVFHVLGVGPSRGRAFLPGEDQPGRTGVVIISESLWQRRFGGSPSALNSTILLDGTPHVVVGILPANFHFPRNDDLGPLSQFGKNTEIFRPLGTAIEKQGWGGDMDFAVLARLASGVALQQGMAELNLFEQQIVAAHPESRGMRCTGKVLQETITAPAATGLYVLFGAVLILMLIVCVNLANLVFARTSVRTRELSIRTALGAGRIRIVQQVLNETLLLALAGGILGLLGASAALRAFVAYAPVHIPRLDEVRVDWRVLAFCFALSLAAGLLAGAIPAFRISRVDPQEALKAATHTSSGGRRDLRMREILVGAEVALSAMLLVCAGLLVGSLRQVLHVDRGFAVQRAVTFSVALPAHYKDGNDRMRFFTSMLKSVSQIPGVEAAGYIFRLPLSGESNVNGIDLEGHGAKDPESQQMILVNVRYISPDYFRAMGLAVLNGRALEERDRDKAVTVVSGRLAAKLWPGLDPLGRKFGTGSGVGTVEVVGVVQDVHNTKLEKDPTLIVYVPYWRRPPYSGDIVVRSSIDPVSLMPELRRRVWAIDSSVPVAQMRTIDDLVFEATSQRRFQMQIVLGFASAALLLALIGIYGVVAYTAAQRRFEMGLRAALGARPRDILGLMTAAGMRPIGVGLIVGLIGAAACGRLLRGLLYGVSPLDPATLISVALVLAAAGGLACWLPGRAVSRVDPSTVLRYE
ncbi:MAG TPA: ABC transporter permease [Bryobacteraceae bacterium]|jgi:predicted permease